MSTVGIIQARLLSSRLPAKILAPLGGRTLLATLVKRIGSAKVDDWWLATTTDRTDDVTAAWGLACGLRVYRGDTDDVLSRFAAVLEQTSAGTEWFVRITADDPFTDGAVIDRLLDTANTLDPEGNVVGELPNERTLPLGYVPQVGRRDAILRLAQELPAQEKHHRSHVLSWFYSHGGLRAFRPPQEWPARAHWRWTVDTSQDLDMAQTAFDAFGTDWASMDYCAMAKILDLRPDITDKNRGERQRQVEEG